MEIHNLTDFFRLSAQLNLQLSAMVVGKSNILSIILGSKPSPNIDREVLEQALEFLNLAYGERRRKIGPLAVLHPLRAASLLFRALDQPTTLDILTEFLHDKLEDITETTIEKNRYQEVEEKFHHLIKTVDPEDEWYLMERLDWLTRRENETYYRYIGRLLDRAQNTQSIVAVKLADRLDNTLDLRIAVEDPIENVDFFEMIFQILYVNSYSGYSPDIPHPPSSPIRSAHRLYQLFKNAVLLSLIRKKKSSSISPGTERLFDALALASMKEAERTTLHIFGYHMQDVSSQRHLVASVMEYVQEGGTERITNPTPRSPLDGLFSTCFDNTDRNIRAQKLLELNDDLELIAQASIAFIVIFQNFLQNPDYWVEGVTEEGILPFGSSL